MTGRGTTEQWIGEDESAKLRATVINGLQNRGLEDTFIAYTDNLAEFDTTIHALASNRNSQRYHPPAAQYQ